MTGVGTGPEAGGQRCPALTAGGERGDQGQEQNMAAAVCRRRWRCVMCIPFEDAGEVM